ncbi:ROK family protein [Saccharibacillus deserti]|uniref:ROK family protein n=1 Tax=Saccharibacillus deserti TaxID=1634444 RepID=UPI001C130570|nr:ROK family protein [Saccharibacillus deserti]
MHGNRIPNIVLGIDLGGTQIKMGLVDHAGDIHSFRSVPTESAKGSRHLLDKLQQACVEMDREARERGFLPVGVGIGTAGFVDTDGRVAYATDNLPGWTGTKLRAEVESATGLPAAVLNDVHALALGEGWRGAAASLKLRDFVCVTLGTGIGGCLIADGNVVRGQDGYAGGFGHQIVMQEGGIPCSCGLSGCWETYASVNALKRLIAERSGTRFASEFPAAAAGGTLEESAPAADPRRLFDAARSGDRQALAIVDEYADRVSVGFVNLIHMLNPRDFVIGGAISAQGGFLLDRINAEIKRRIMPVYGSGGIRLHAAELGDKAGVVGAAYALLRQN